MSIKKVLSMFERRVGFGFQQKDNYFEFKTYRHVSTGEFSWHLFKNEEFIFHICEEAVSLFYATMDDDLVCPSYQDEEEEKTK